MNSIHWKMLILVSSLVAAVGCGGAREIESDWERYEPPPLARAYMERNTTPDPMVAKPGAVGDPGEELAEIRKRWSQNAALDPKADGESTLPSVQSPPAPGPDAWKALLEDDWSLESAKVLALRRNPGIQAAEQRFMAEVETLDQVESLDAVLRQYSAFADTVMPGVGPMKSSPSIQMQFPFPGITALKGEIADQNIRAAYEAWDGAERDTVVAVETAFWDLQFVYEAARITRETLDLFNHLENVANTRYEAGKTSYQDIVKVRIRQKTLQEDLQSWKERRRTFEVKIGELLSFPTHRPLGKPGDATVLRSLPDPDSLVDLALHSRQELRRMRAVIAKMERMVAMAETMRLPSYGPNHSRFENRPVQTTGTGAKREAFPAAVEAQRGAGVPKTPWFGTQDAYLRETRRRLEAMRRELAEAEAKTTFQIQRIWQELDQAIREERLYRDSIVSLTGTSLEVSTREYESGDISFAEVIDSHTLWLESQLQLAVKVRDIGRFRAELLRWTGRRTEVQAGDRSAPQT